MSYSGHLPENCPPEDSEPVSGKVFRFIHKTHEEPLPKDFLSWRELNPDKPCSPALTECQACGVSVYKTLDDAVNLSKRIPRFKGMKIAEGILNSSLGKIKHTPSRNEKSHQTWWIMKNVEPWKEFKVINYKTYISDN